RPRLPAGAVPGSRGRGSHVIDPSMRSAFDRRFGVAGADAASKAECAPFHEGRMHRVLILGAGKIGALIAGLLAESGTYRVQLADVDGSAAEAVARAHSSAHSSAHLSAFALDATNGEALTRHLAAHPADAVISSLPYYCNVTVAEAARRAHLHY